MYTTDAKLTRMQRRTFSSLHNFLYYSVETLDTRNSPQSNFCYCNSSNHTANRRVKLSELYFIRATTPQARGCSVARAMRQ